jgi:two-component system phosphate regulon sensor histidine kinase PhoR
VQSSRVPRARLHRKLFASYLGVIAVAVVVATVLVERWSATGTSGPGVRAIFAAAGFAVAAGVLFSWLAARRVSRQVRELAQAAREFSDGKLPAPKVQSDDEVGDLQEAFATLGKRVAETVRTLSADGARLRSVLEGMSEGVALIERGRIALANPAFERLFDVQGHAAGRTPLEAARSSDLAKAIAQANTSSPAVGRDLDGPGGKVLHLRAEALDSGAVVVVLLDVTVARSLERMRRDFVANASHELRTPVAAIRAVVETLFENPSLDASARARFEGMLSAHVERLSRLVNDLLDLSHAEAGAPRGKPELLDMGDPLSVALSTVRTRAEKKNLRIEEQVPEQLPPIEADPIAIEQILTNLLDNAVKYTPEGRRIKVRAVADEDQVWIEVEDNGAGIAAEHLPRLFERFYRVDPARSRALGGTGLGLAIVKHLVQANGGEVTVTSTPGVGSCFRVTFPRARTVT